MCFWRIVWVVSYFRIIGWNWLIIGKIGFYWLLNSGWLGVGELWFGESIIWLCKNIGREVVGV